MIFMRIGDPGIGAERSKHSHVLLLFHEHLFHKTLHKYIHMQKSCGPIYTWSI